MLGHISLFTSFIFAVIYPLCFWINVKNPIEHQFQRFHLGTPNIIAGIVCTHIYLNHFSPSTTAWTIFWFLSITILTAFFWNKPHARCLPITLSSAIGLLAFSKLYYELVSPDPLHIIIWILSGAIFSAAFWAMNLGHFYLNVHGLPLKHLRNATIVLWSLSALRFLWDAAYLFIGSIQHNGYQLQLYKFTLTMDGFLVLIAIFFGTLFPIIALYFVFETIKLKNTQSATGILYVILAGILLGDLAYKYYLLKFNILL